MKSDVERIAEAVAGTVNERHRVLESIGRASLGRVPRTRVVTLNKLAKLLAEIREVLHLVS